jgi:hypothetical protein
VRASTASAIVGVFLAGGLTAWSNPCLESLCRGRAQGIGTRMGEWTDQVITELKTRFGGEEDIHRPGPTYALVVSKDLIVGVDRDGYVSCRETSFDGDLAALTGFAVAPDSIGEQLGIPELVLGLTIVRAFDRSEDMPDMLSEVYLGDPENPRVVLCGGVTVEIGAGDYGTKIARLRQILLQAPELGIRPTRVDMRFGPQVVVEYEQTKQQPRKEV